tara:strand:+ start:410 stop:544 length:135 start_codon:yes stop_codon:yes gene_type:complete
MDDYLTVYLGYAILGSLLVFSVSITTYTFFKEYRIKLVIERKID